jgi:hypothetical protein
MTGSSRHDQAEERWSLDREVDALQRAVAARGEVGRSELAEAVDARDWGPGRFRSALREAVRRRALGRYGRGRYGPPERKNVR